MNNHPEPEQLSAYVDGQLDGAERDDLEQHLTGCSDCSATVRGIRATLADLRALPTPAPSETDSWRLRAAVADKRKRPAAHYRQWVAAAGIAAAVIGLVVITTGRTASSTFSHTGAEVASGGAERAPASLPPIEVLTNDYTASSATGLVARSFAGSVGGPVAAQPKTATPAPTIVDGTSQSYSSQISGYLSQIQGCERTIFPSGSAHPTPVRYVVATYKETPAFFLVYEVGSSKLELYVVQVSDCYIRLFLPPR